jgi:iron complex outermembrane recepter protein
MNRFCSPIQFVRQLLTLAVGLASLVAVAQTGSGTIEGRVLNSATGNYLNNARVTIAGTNLEAFTNEIGEYRLSNVPPGAATVRAGYTGLLSQTTSVTVAAGQRATQDFSLTRADTPRASAAGDAIMPRNRDQRTALQRELEERRFRRRVR